MKRFIALAILLMIPLVVVVAFVMLEARRGPDWQFDLNEYLTDKAQTSGAMTLRAVVRAREPWNFSPEMGRPVRDDWRWGIDELPFPPLEVQCVLLERGDAATPQRQVVFIGYHTDRLWRVGWLVHEGPTEPFPLELTDHLAMIGCDLDLE